MEANASGRRKTARQRSSPLIAVPLLVTPNAGFCAKPSTKSFVTPARLELTLYAQYVYTIGVFEWHDVKRQSNIEKHGLDFIDAVPVFDGRFVISFPAKTETET